MANATHALRWFEDDDDSKRARSAVARKLWTFFVSSNILRYYSSEYKIYLMIEINSSFVGFLFFGERWKIAFEKRFVCCLNMIHFTLSTVLYLSINLFGFLCFVVLASKMFVNSREFCCSSSHSLFILHLRSMMMILWRRRRRRLQATNKKRKQIFIT